MNVLECKEKIAKLEKSLGNDFEYDIVASLIGGDYKEISVPRLTNIKKEEIKITDTDGRFSAKVNLIEEQLHLSTVPLEVCKIPSSIVELKTHSIIDINGVRCASSKDRFIQKELVDNVILSIGNTLSKGENFIKEISKHVKIKDKDYSVIDFNIYELSHICSYYSNCEIKCVEKDSKTYLVAYLVSM